MRIRTRISKNWVFIAALTAVVASIPDTAPHAQQATPPPPSYLGHRSRVLFRKSVGYRTTLIMTRAPAQRTIPAGDAPMTAISV